MRKFRVYAFASNCQGSEEVDYIEVPDNYDEKQILKAVKEKVLKMVDWGYEEIKQ